MMLTLTKAEEYELQKKAKQEMNPDDESDDEESKEEDDIDD